MKTTVRNHKMIQSKWIDHLSGILHITSALLVVVFLFAMTTTIDAKTYNAKAHQAEIIGADGNPIVLKSGSSLMQQTGRSVEVVDSLALVALYHAGQGAHWVNNSGWLTDMVEFWHGVNQVMNVGTDEDPVWRVTRIRFADNNMTVPGVFAHEIGNMTELRWLFWRRSMLRGTVPKEFGNLKKMERFEIHNNDLEGELPWQELSELPNMVQFFVNTNRFEGTIPPVIKEFQSVREIYIHNNYFSGEVPKELGEMPDLWRDLRMGGNLFTGQLPDLSQSHARGIERLDIGPNNFDAAPFPEWIRDNSEAMRTLRIADCNLYGDIPSWLDELENLRWLTIGDEFLTGQLPDLSFNPNLTRLDIYKTSMSGEFPSWIARVPNLSIFTLTDTPWTGTLPTEFADIPLTELHITRSHLTGQIPAALSMISSLRRLTIQNNKYMEVGELPSWIGQLSSLERINFSRMGFTGEIPGATFAALQGLTQLDLSRNELTGGIPADFGNLPELQALNLSRNQLTGGLPSALQNVRNMLSLNVSYNPLEIGSMPNWLTQYPALSSLDLRATGLTGPIPEWISTLFFVRDLYLSENELTGTIPSQMADMGVHPAVDMRRIHLDYNQLTGDIPTFFQRFNYLEELDLSGNDFNPGPVPTFLLRLDSLQVIGLSETNRTGEIPYWLSDLHFPNLRILTLNGNELTGAIPAALGTLVLMDSLNIGDNQLTGGLDALIGTGVGDNRTDYTTMSSLIVSGNPGLTGPVPMEFTEWDTRIMRVIWFDDTDLCEPDDQEFHDWLDEVAELSIAYHYNEDVLSSVQRTGVLCSEVVSSESADGLPLTVRLHQNYPNPFNPTSTIKFEVPVETHVTMTVYNLLGQKVAVLVNEQMNAGYHQVQFDASRMASGTYMYRMEADGRALTQTMMLIK